MKIAITTFLLLFALPGFAQLNWESRASLPNQGLSNAISFNVGGKIYVGLGETFDGTFSKALWQYDPSKNIWTRKSNYPGNGSRHAIAFVIGTKAYVGLGGSPTTRYADFYEYNPSTDQWTQKANFPGGGRYAAETFVIGDSAYVALGSCGGPSCYNNELWMYVPGSNSWKQMSDWPGGDGVQPVTFSIGGYGYVGNQLRPDKSLSNDFYRYAPSSDSWSKIASMPGTARKSTSAFVINNKAYVGFGSFGSPTTGYSNELYQYDPSTNTWTKFTSNNDFTPREVVRFEAISDTMVFGGLGYNNFEELTDFWQLKLDTIRCEFYDTTEFVKYDTNYVNDTSWVTIYDTNIVSIYDTILVTFYDTTMIFDTISFTVFDTLTVIETVYRIDTIEILIYDTLTNTTYDTLIVYQTISVEDTLNVYLYDYGGCSLLELKLYPNPTHEFVYLFTKQPGCFQGGEVQIIDQLGQVVLRRTYDKQLITLDIRGLASAVYYIRLLDNNKNEVFIRKISVY